MYKKCVGKATKSSILNKINRFTKTPEKYKMLLVQLDFIISCSLIFFFFNFVSVMRPFRTHHKVGSVTFFYDRI